MDLGHVRKAELEVDHLSNAFIRRAVATSLAGAPASYERGTPVTRQGHSLLMSEVPL